MSDIYLNNGKPVKRRNGLFNPFDRSFAKGLNKTILYMEVWGWRIRRRSLGNG